MAFRCSVCQKGPATGKSVSHSHIGTKRRFLPNLQKIKVALSGGRSKKQYVCTRCLRYGKVRKAA